LENIASRYDSILNPPTFLRENLKGITLPSIRQEFCNEKRYIFRRNCSTGQTTCLVVQVLLMKVLRHVNINWVIRKLSIVREAWAEEMVDPEKGVRALFFSFSSLEIQIETHTTFFLL
jgi:hypothetical protein